MRRLLALLLLGALPTGCGGSESAKSAGAHLTTAGSALCRQAKQERSRFIKHGGFGREEHRLAFRAAEMLRALLHADARLPRVKTLLADVRAAKKARAQLESPGISHGAPLVRRVIKLIREGRAELTALGLSACLGAPAKEALEY